ncbi:formylglycine-generating enzyme family protein [Sorangium sp. So ce1099]|uniref:formylglycine-generating enzyme family protein n=1 Tax=Sorangium sp. So ce1099 TaxID=3133331 RepID=UPI003F5FF479
MSRSLASSVRSSLGARVLETAALQIGLVAVLAGCSPRTRDFRGAGAGDPAQGGGGAGGGGAGGHAAGGCVTDERRCADNNPQRCDDRGDWNDEAPCPARAPVCSGGACTTPPSCAGLVPTCGPAGDESCCAATELPGGTFRRSNEEKYPAMVSTFLLDRFEVTVGRFRAFVEAYPGSFPERGAGAHPRINASGWDPSWNMEMPPSAAMLKEALHCDATYQTWTEEAGEHEHLPMNCLSWYVAFAFCAWDGGRLPTEAEWNYAAAGGDEQRAYPWSNPAVDTTIDRSYAVYDCGGDGTAGELCSFDDIQYVGSRSMKGDGRWGQADLAGGLWEWVLDRYADYTADPPCDDCANLTAASNRVFRGGSFSSGASYLLSAFRSDHDPSDRSGYVGVRCARNP